VSNAYVVVGVTGEYSDRTEWYVACYLDQVQAELHVSRLMTAAAREGIVMGKGRVSWGARTGDRSPEMLALDSSLGAIDYTGVDYYVVSIPLQLAAPGAP
jgi:hypothetical protein